MRIALAGVITKPIIKDPLGGTEAFTYLLVQGLVERGHQITLYCSQGSQTPAQKHVFICKPEEAMGSESNVEFVYPYTLFEIRKIIEDINKNEFDLLHINILKTFMFSYFAYDFKIPIIHTIHRDFFNNQRIFKLYEKIGFNKNENFVFVSQNAFKLNLYKKKSFWVHNGIDPEKYPFTKIPSRENLIWLSRVDPLKGPKEAILTAQATKKKLILSGDIDRKKYEDYFEREIKPLIHSSNNLIEYEPYQSPEKKTELFANAKAFLFPINWEEPFGLVIVESMACGTPVIAFARGAAPEIIEDGKTGLLVNSSNQDIRGNWLTKKTGIEGLTEAVNYLYSLSEEKYQKMRNNCRKTVEEKFNFKKMAENYEKIYEKVINSK